MVYPLGSPGCIVSLTKKNTYTQLLPQTRQEEKKNKNLQGVNKNIVHPSHSLLVLLLIEPCVSNNDACYVILRSIYNRGRKNGGICFFLLNFGLLYPLWSPQTLPYTNFKEICKKKRVTSCEGVKTNIIGMPLFFFAKRFFVYLARPQFC